MAAKGKGRQHTPLDSTRDGRPKAAAEIAGPPAAGAGAPHGSSRRHALTVLGLGLLVLVSYFPALSGGFVWDDVIFSEEPVLQRWSGLWSVWFAPADIKNEGHYWPIVYSSFWLEHKLWGLAPMGYHIVNLLLHWVNTLLVWRLLARLSVPGALATAVVFAVHPLHVESVAWLIERKDLLSGLFYFAAALAWMRFVETPNRWNYGLALGFYVAAMLSKSVAVTLPVALLIWHWWQRERITAADLARLVPFFVIGLAITGADYLYYSGREPLDLGYSLVERVLIASRALCFYVGKLLWPTDLAVIYPVWDVGAGNPLAWAYAAAVAATAALLWLGRRRSRAPLAAALFYAVTLAPVLGFIDYGYMQFAFAADRFQYVAGLGVMAFLVGAAAWGARRLSPTLALTARGAFAAGVAALAALSWTQSGIYRDEVAFFGHIAARNPAARDAYLNLSSALFKRDRFEEGLAASRRALEIRPDSAKALSNVGHGLLTRGDFDEAESYLKRAVKIDPRHVAAHQNLGEVLRKTKRHEEALSSYRTVLRIDTDYALAHSGMAAALYELKRYEEAASTMAKSLSLDPDTSQAAGQHRLIGMALQASGKPREAETYLRRAMELAPHKTEYLLALALLLREQQRGAEADELLDRAKARSRNDVVGLHNVAEALRLQGRHASAMESYRAALAVEPEFAPAHAGLGIALFRTGKHADAIDAMARALRLKADLPVAPTLRILMARAHEAMGDTARAGQVLERALEHDPSHEEALDRLALMRFGQKRYGEALRLYRKLLELVPDAAQHHSNLGATLYHLGQTREALASFERALALKPDLKMAQRGVADMRRLLARSRKQP